jgi:hypothetical protein
LSVRAARRVKTPALRTCCSKPWGGVLNSTATPAETPHIETGSANGYSLSLHMHSIQLPPLARVSNLRLQSTVRCRPRRFRRTTRQQRTGPVAQRLEQGTHKGKCPFLERPSKKRYIAYFIGSNALFATSQKECTKVQKQPVAGVYTPADSLAYVLENLPVV